MSDGFWTGKPVLVTGAGGFISSHLVVTIGELADMIFRIIGRQVRIECEDQRLRPEKSEVMRLLSDNSLAKLRLGWQPEVTLEVGLLKTIQWIEQHPDLFNPDRYEF